MGAIRRRPAARARCDRAAGSMATLLVVALAGGSLAGVGGVDSASKGYTPAADGTSSSPLSSRRRSDAAAAGTKQVGCFWYPKQCVVPGFALTQRNLSDLPIDTCTYVDLGNLCIFNITADGGLNVAQRGCTGAAEAVAADARLAKRNHRSAGVPALRMYWGLWMVGPNHAAQVARFGEVFSDHAKIERLVSELKGWTAQHSDVVDGFNIDWELTPPTPQSKKGFGTFLRRLTEETGLRSILDTGDLTTMQQNVDVAAAQPYLDYVEFMTYFTNLTAPLTPRPSVEDNINALLAPPFNYQKDQIIVGVGFSSGSTANVSTAEVSSCAYWGWGCTGPYTSNGPHSSVGMNSMTWDRIAADVDAGKGYRGMSGAKEGYAHWYFFPDPATGNATGELTWWNSLSDFEYYTSFVNERQLGGVFSWVATSDAPDWRVHKQLHRDLLTSLQN
eukprot:COSAG03_NODE_1484_length_4001_cov_8.606868_2_plen_446_part_00